ncbi:hypothetical protein BDW02DRAFT_421464 [Decorospora gaudefroyi]|uniref:Uncharacterized protein n=1 Tax=Decorospora gaudefroyi TaxID=184978 RepID=A0A6A5KGU4_9PLEO|nr:hypothetical protein BDW02DRAFT_421464 [Decorospora gaudefroyi]
MHCDHFGTLSHGRTLLYQQIYLPVFTVQVAELPNSTSSPASTVQISPILVPCYNTQIPLKITRPIAAVTCTSTHTIVTNATATCTPRKSGRLITM